MKLRTYIFFIVLGVFTLSFFISSFYTNDALHAAIDEVNDRELTKVGSHIQAIIKSKREKIEDFTRVMMSEGELESVFNIGLMSGEWIPFHQKLAQLKKESNFDIIEYISNEGASMEFRDRDLAKTILKAANSVNDNFQALQWGNKIALVSVTPMKARGISRGILFMGTILTDALEKRISELTKSKIRFVLTDASSNSQKRDKNPGVFELIRSGDRVLKVRVELDEAFLDALGKKTKVKLAKATLVIFAFAILLLYLFTEMGFLRRLEELNRATKIAADHLDAGKIDELLETKHPIQEVKSFSSSLSKFSKSIKAYDEKVKEQAKIAAQAREREALSQMAEQVAHDLKSPLLGLSSMVNGLNDSVPQMIQKAMRDALSKIRHTVDNLNKTVLTAKNAMAATGKKKTEVLTIPQERLGPQLLSTLVDSVITQKLVEYSEKREIEIFFELEPGAYGIWAEVHPEQFGIVLSNLINNGIEAISGEGGVIVALERIGKNVRVRIIDDGCGIPEDILRRLGERGLTTKPNGQGIGFSSAKEIVESWRGHIKVQTKKDRSTTVDIILPEAAAPRFKIFPLFLKSGSRPGTIQGKDKNKEPHNETGHYL